MSVAGQLGCCSVSFLLWDADIGAATAATHWGRRKAQMQNVHWLKASTVKWNVITSIGQCIQGVGKCDHIGDIH